MGEDDVVLCVFLLFSELSPRAGLLSEACRRLFSVTYLWVVSGVFLPFAVMREQACASLYPPFCQLPARIYRQVC